MFFPNPMEMMGQGIDSIIGPIMDRMLEAMQKILDTILALSDDIGKMADRIGDFGDKILSMADKIGGMSDKIVGTMDTMSTNLQDLSASGNTGTVIINTSSVVLLSPATNVEISRTNAPTISISDEANSYMLYASNYQTFANGQTIAVLVSDATTLTEAWDMAVEIAEDNTLYIAVKSIDEANKVSSLSNSVLVQLVD